MTQSRLLLLFVLLTGVVLGAFARGVISDPSAPPTDGADLDRQKHTASDPVPQPGSSNKELQGVIDFLQFELDTARTEREELRAEIETLQERIASLDEAKNAANTSQAATGNTRLRRRGGGALTVELLTDAGINEADAVAIKKRMDELSLQRLYLRDQAVRDGSIGKNDYRDRIREINEAQANLANEFGENNFDRYLYASGRPNRVSVQSVIENSPAYNAGMQTGDRIVSYNESRVYNAGEIRRGISGGTAGDMVSVIVERDGRRFDLYVPRGPLGIQMNSESIRPPENP